jgi:hypothetical protein
MIRIALPSTAAAFVILACSGHQNTKCNSDLNFTAPFVNVMVTDCAAGQPLCGASVSLSGPAQTPAVRSIPAVADASCRYEGEVGGAAGTYMITVSAPGYQTASESISVITESCGECCTELALKSSDGGPVPNGAIHAVCLRP